ncbi:Gfo/Idh/MocA family oxidoreductase [Mesorhizobium sp. M0088]|uniref:Gfo/Idh/MocA family protein n=1 Tax=Mesorhizobium sp. M0088 TaxID=2956873 RepID=UPI00333506E6
MILSSTSEPRSHRIRIGIAGAGLWAERAHVPSFSRLPEMDIVAVADPDQNRAASLADRVSGCKVYRDAHTMLSAGLDAIIIATPEDTHYAVARAAIESGVHVLCEKPLARTVDEARELSELAARSNVITRIGFVLRYSPAMRQLKRLVDSGYTGKIHSFVFSNNFPQFFFPNEPFHWVMDAARTGGGAFMEYGCHGLDLARWLVGEIDEICASAVTLVTERADPVSGAMRTITVDDVCSWLGRFENGAEGQFHVSWSSLPGFGFQVAVSGEKGTLGWRMTKSWPFAELLGCRDPDGEFQPISIDEAFTEGSDGAATWRDCFAAGQARRFRDEIASGRIPEGPDFADGLANQFALDAISRSLNDRCWISVERR